MTDRITSAVCHDLRVRADLGLSRYGVTVADATLSRRQWLQHLYEELLDGAVYVKRALEMEGRE